VTTASTTEHSQLMSSKWFCSMFWPRNYGLSFPVSRLDMTNRCGAQSLNILYK